MLTIWMFAVGLLVVPSLPFFIPFPLLFAFICLSLLLQRAGYTWSRFGLCLALGLLINTWQLQSLSQAQLAHSFDNSWQTLTFKIVSIPERGELSTKFIAEVQDIECQALACPAIIDRRIRLSWYRPHHELEPGQVWSAKTKLKRPRGLANPGGFDYHAWLLGQDLVATGYVHSNAKLVSTQFSWASVRKSLVDKVSAQAGDHGYARFWSTLLVADRSAVTSSDWQTLQATGTIHLMAISGLHIGLVSLWAFWLGRMVARGWSLVAGRSAALVMHWLPPLLSCFMAMFYAALAGFSIPTLRALVACSAINICWVFGLRIGPLTLLGLGVAVVVLGEPLAWQSNGFWLSFAAVFLLIHTLSGRVVRQPVRIAIGMQLALSLGLCVPLLWLGQGVSWVSPLANLVAVPVVSFLIVPGLFIAVLMSVISNSVTHSVLLILDWVFDVLWHYLLWLQALPQTLVWSPKPLGGAALSIAFCGILLLLAPRGLRVRGLGVLALCVAAAIKPAAKPALRMTVMDVGQGLSVVVQTSANTWVYDTGPAYSESFDAGSRIIAPYLRAQGVREIDLIVSHADNDHSGGAASLLSLVDVRTLLVGERLPEGADEMTPIEQEAKPAQQFCQRGQIWQVDSMTLSVLWPPEPGIYESNNASCVVLLEMPLKSAAEQAPVQMVRILLTGDIDSKIEAQLLQNLPRNIDIVIAAHHGSKSSSSYRFVRQLKPGVVVFSAGYNNRYNHPHPKIVSRYQARGAATYTTATSGAVVFEWRDGVMAVTETRVAEAKLWYQ